MLYMQIQVSGIYDKCLGRQTGVSHKYARLGLSDKDLKSRESVVLSSNQAKANQTKINNLDYKCRNFQLLIDKNCPFQRF